MFFFGEAWRQIQGQRRRFNRGRDSSERTVWAGDSRRLVPATSGTVHMVVAATLLDGKLCSHTVGSAENHVSGTGIAGPVPGLLSERMHVTPSSYVLWIKKNNVSSVIKAVGMTVDGAPFLICTLIDLFLFPHQFHYCWWKIDKFSDEWCLQQLKPRNSSFDQLLSCLYFQDIATVMWHRVGLENAT